LRLLAGNVAVMALVAVPKKPELSGIIMEINDLREFGRLVFQTRLLPQENAKNTKTRGYVNCFVFFCRAIL